VCASRVKGVCVRAVLALNQNSKFTVGCPIVLIEVLVVRYHTAFMCTAQATTVNLPVLSG